jgi:hypothetical protein
MLLLNLENIMNKSELKSKYKHQLMLSDFTSIIIVPLGDFFIPRF